MSGGSAFGLYAKRYYDMASAVDHPDRNRSYIRISRKGISAGTVSFTDAQETLEDSRMSSLASICNPENVSVLTRDIIAPGNDSDSEDEELSDPGTPVIDVRNVFSATLIVQRNESGVGQMLGKGHGANQRYVELDFYSILQHKSSYYAGRPRSFFNDPWSAEFPAFEIIRRLNRTEMKDGTELDVRQLGSSDMTRTTSIGVPARGRTAASGKDGHCAPDALTILAEGHFPGALRSILEKMPARHSYKSLNEFVGLLRDNGRLRLQFTSLPDEKKMRRSHKAAEHRLNAVLNGGGKDYMLVDVLEFPNSPGHCVFVDQVSGIVVDPSCPTMNLPLSTEGFAACCSSGIVEGLHCVRIVRRS
jgi:hypothetical protein